MRWTCRVMRHPGGDWVTGPDGREVAPPAKVIYRGMFRLRTFMPHEATPDVGGSTVTVVRTNAHLPAVERLQSLAESGAIECDLDEMPFREGDVVVREVAGRSARYYRVASPHDITDQTAQRLLVDEGGPELEEGGPLDG